MKKLPITISLRIRAARDRVFTAWVASEIAERWQCDRLEGEWTPNSTVAWHFGETRQPLAVDSVEQNCRLEFRWRAGSTEPETRVQILFTELGEETGIKVQEFGWEMTEETLPIVVDHSCGWENMLCRLKVWMELGAYFSNSTGSFQF